MDPLRQEIWRKSDISILNRLKTFPAFESGDADPEVKFPNTNVEPSLVLLQAQLINILHSSLTIFKKCLKNMCFSASGCPKISGGKRFTPDSTED